MRRILDRLYLYSGYIAALFILTICITVMAQVTLNIVDKLSSTFGGGAIGLSIPSYSDFTGFFLAAASFFALAHTLREGGHIRVTLFIMRMPESVRKVVDMLVVTCAMAITVFVTVYVILLTHESWEYGDLSTGIVPVPLWIPQSAVAAGLVVLSIALIDELYGLVRGNEASYEGKGENLLLNDDEQNNNKENTVIAGAE